LWLDVDVVLILESETETLLLKTWLIRGRDKLATTTPMAGKGNDDHLQPGECIIFDLRSSDRLGDRWSGVEWRSECIDLSDFPIYLLAIC